MNPRKIFETIQTGSTNDLPSKLFDFFILVSIILNILLSVFSTFSISNRYKSEIYFIEAVTVIFFTIEYILRVNTAEFLYPKVKKSEATLKYIFSFSGIVDFLSFFPFYLPFFFPNGAVAFRIFRIIRILRLFRINQYYDALNVISDVLKKKRGQLFSSVFIIFTLMVAASLLMYDVEHRAQPDVFTDAFSGFWWAASTLLTIGYGDIYPVTTIGKVFGIIFAFLGVGLVAIPTGILSAGFVEQLTEVQPGELHSKEKPNFCPHCGKKL